jgi:hypothetical protein
MTIATSVSRSGPYAGAGQTGPFVIGFRFLENAHLLVVKTDSSGTEATLILTTDYTVTGAGAESGGVLTLIVALSVGYTLTIQRDVPVTQLADYTQSDSFPAQSHEDALDKLTMISQQLDDSVRRSLRVPEVGTTLPTLPSVSARAGKLSGWDVNGNPVALTQVGGSVLGTIVATTETVAATAGQTVINLSNSYSPGTASLMVFADGILLNQPEHYTETSSTSITLTTALATDTTIVVFAGHLVTSAVEAEQVSFTLTATGSAARLLTGKLGEAPSIDDFAGATDHAKLTAAVAHANLAGCDILVPARTVNINSDLGSITLEEVTLRGVGVGDGATATIDAGSNFYITGTTNSPFKIRRGASIVGCGFYYPNQTNSATPTAYPATLDFDSTASDIQFVNIRNNVVFNAYDFLRMNHPTGGIGHTWIEDNTICALRRAIEISWNLEVIKISGNTFSFGHWLAATEGGARAFYRANAITVKYDRGDGIFFHDNLVFGSLTGLSLAATNTVQLCEVIGNKFDQVRYAIEAAGSGNWTHSLVVGNEFYCVNTQNTTLQANAIRITTAGSAADESITIGVNSFVLSTEDMIYTSGNAATRFINVSPSNFYLWAAYKAAGAYGALNINGSLTSLTISGGWLRGLTYTAYANGIMGSFNTLACNGVTFQGCKQPINATVNSATGAGNVSYLTNAATSDQITATTLCWGPNRFDKPHFKTPLVIPLADMASYANDAAAAAAGVPIGGFYRNASAMNIRIV